MQAAFGVQPGTHLTVKSMSEALHLTLAYAAVSSVVAAIDISRSGGTCVALRSAILLKKHACKLV